MILRSQADMDHVGEAVNDEAAVELVQETARMYSYGYPDAGHGRNHGHKDDPGTPTANGPKIMVLTTISMTKRLSAPSKPAPPAS